MFDEPLYNIADIVKITKLTDRTIRNYLAKGILKGKKIGGQWRFNDQDLCMLFSNNHFENDMKNKVENQMSDFLIKMKQINKYVLSLKYKLLIKKNVNHF